MIRFGIMDYRIDELKTNQQLQIAQNLSTIMPANIISVALIAKKHRFIEIVANELLYLQLISVYNNRDNQQL